MTPTQTAPEDAFSRSAWLVRRAFVKRARARLVRRGDEEAVAECDELLLMCEEALADIDTQQQPQEDS